MDSQDKKSLTRLLIVVLIVVMAGALFIAYSGPRESEKDIGTKLNNAAEEVGEGLEDASEELRDRSTKEKIGDAIEDTGESIQDMAK